MKRLVLVFALFAIASCSTESGLPNPTGKGTIRALNAMVASPDVGFRIEARLLSSLGYQESSVAQRFDDFDYVFNFEASFFGDPDPRTVASTAFKVETGQDYTMVLTGDVTAPTVTVWETSERTWAGTETVFEMRFAHTAATVGAIDVYFAPDGTAPVIGEERGTLNFGEVLPSLDIEEGDYVLTVTTAGDETDILFQTAAITYSAQNALMFPIFDGDELTSAAITARLINVIGAATSITDVNALPTIRFIQSSFDFANSDIYDDEMLTNLVLSDHAFRDFTGDIVTDVATTTYTYTTVGDTSAVLFESGITKAAGRHYNYLVIGREGERLAHTYVPDRRSVATFAKLRVYNASFNHQAIDLYVLEAGMPIDEESPLIPRLAYSLIAPTLAYDTGSYDLYLTLPGEKTIVAGPMQFDLTIGDNVEVFFIDTVDTATAEILVVPNTL